MGSLYTAPSVNINSNTLSSDQFNLKRLYDVQQNLNLAAAGKVDIADTVKNYAQGNVQRTDLKVFYSKGRFQDTGPRINSMLEVAPGYQEHKVALERAIAAYSTGEFSQANVSKQITRSGPQTFDSYTVSKNTGYIYDKVNTPQSLAAQIKDGTMNFSGWAKNIGSAVNPREHQIYETAAQTVDYSSIYKQGLDALNAEYEKLYGVNGTYGAKAAAPPVTKQPGEGISNTGVPNLLSRYKAAIAARKGTGA